MQIVEILFQICQNCLECKVDVILDFSLRSLFYLPPFTLTSSRRDATDLLMDAMYKFD